MKAYTPDNPICKQDERKDLITVAKITRTFEPGGIPSGYITTLEEADLKAELWACEPDESFTVTLLTMSRKDYESLPEFRGW